MIYLLALAAVSLMTVAQLFLKKGLGSLGGSPQNIGEIAPFFFRAFTNLYVLGAFGMVLLTALVWILAVSKAQLSYIYPFMALSYVLVAFFSWMIFKEDITTLRLAGIILISFGVFLVAKS